MPSLGSPANLLPAGEDYVVRRIKAVEDGLREGLASIAASFGPAMATLTAQQAATAANVADIAANVASINTLIRQQVAPAALYGSSAGFAVTPAETVILTITVTVPAGFTKAAISVVGRVFAFNPNTTGGSNGVGGDYLRARAKISGFAGWALPEVVLGSNSSSVSTSPFSKVLTGLTPGSTFAVSVGTYSDLQTFGASAGNTAEISGSVQWFR